MHLPLTITVLLLFPPTLASPLDTGINNAAINQSPCHKANNINQPYCPHNINNLESPLEGSTHNLGSSIRMSWNAQWNPFASQRNIDIYFCPPDNTQACVNMALNINNDIEVIERVLYPNKLSVGAYYYLVVASGNSPTDVAFTNLGPRFYIAPSVTTNIPQPTNTNDHDSTSTAPQSTSSNPFLQNTSLSNLAIILISSLGALLFVFLVLAVVLHLRYSGQIVSAPPPPPPSKPSLTPTPVPHMQPTNAKEWPKHPITYIMTSNTLSSSTTSLPNLTRPANKHMDHVGSRNSGPRSTPTSIVSLTIPHTGDVNRLIATPISAGAISSTEAILIANSFKLALKKSIDDEDDDQDISTMISSLGIQGGVGEGGGLPAPKPPPAPSDSFMRSCTVVGQYPNSRTGSNTSLLPTLTSELSVTSPRKIRDSFVDESGMPVGGMTSSSVYQSPSSRRTTILHMSWEEVPEALSCTPIRFVASPVNSVRSLDQV